FGPRPQGSANVAALPHVRGPKRHCSPDGRSRPAGMSSLNLPFPPGLLEVPKPLVPDPAAFPLGLARVGGHHPAPFTRHSVSCGPCRSSLTSHSKLLFAGSAAVDSAAGRCG